MNDSFLEDLELLPADARQPARSADRHVTTRAASSPMQLPSDGRMETVTEKPERPGQGVSEGKQGKESQARRSSEKDSRKQTVRMKLPEKKERSVENKLRPVENRVKSDTRDRQGREEQKSTRVSDPKQKSDWKGTERERSKNSTGQKENAQSPDLSAKENRPSDSSRESKSPSDSSKDRSRKCDCSKRPGQKEKDPVALLNAIKDLISTYTKQESAKILRAMQELHLNSQANLIKNFIMQTDDLVKEMHPSKDSTRIRALMEQNERLQEDVAVLQRRNEDLRRKLEEFEVIREENVNLKLRYLELTKQQ